MNRQFKHLGHVITCSLSDDEDLQREMRISGSNTSGCNLLEDDPVDDVAVVDADAGRQKVKEVGVVLPLLLHEQIAIVVSDATAQVPTDLALFLFRHTQTNITEYRPAYRFNGPRLDTLQVISETVLRGITCTGTDNKN